jgi:hypothetical protein
MRRSIASLAAAATLLLVLAAPVGAAPPVGSCPGPFTVTDIPNLLVLLENPDAGPLADVIDANDNGMLCYQAHPEWSRAAEVRGFPVIYNVIDDAAMSR